MKVISDWKSSRIVCCLVCLSWGIVARGAIACYEKGCIPNYEKSESLGEANYLLSEDNPDIGTIDRNRVIKLLLTYLEEYPNTLNRTSVYSKVGLLYLHQNQTTDTAQDPVQAKKYFEMAIAADPDYFNHFKVLAYTNLVSLPNTCSERVTESIRLYKILSGVSENRLVRSVRREADLRKQTIIKGSIQEVPLDPHSNEYAEILKQGVARLKEEIAITRVVVLTNLLDDAKRTESPEASLKNVKSELKDYPEVVKKVDEALEAIATHKQESSATQ